MLLLTRMGEALFRYLRPRGFEKFLHGPGNGMRGRMINSIGSASVRQFGLERLDLVPRRADGGHRARGHRPGDRGLLRGRRRGPHHRPPRQHHRRLLADDGAPAAELDDGTRLPADLIVCATGFTQGVPFLPAEVRGGCSTSAAGDDAAWVELAAQKKGRVLASSLANLIVYSREEATRSYRESPIERAAAKTTPGELTADLLAQLNVARRAAKMPALTLAPRQSAENARLAGTLLRARQTGDAQADTIALGLLAGWDVDGLVRAGDFFLGEACPARDAKAWLDYAVTSPLARRVLFDRAAKQIAIGAVVPESAPAIAAVVTTYSFYDSSEHAGDVAKLHEKIAAARGARGLAAHTRIEETPELTARAAQVRDHGLAPMRALDDVIHDVNETTSRAVNGWVFEGTDIDSIAIPDELLSGNPGYLAIEVTHHRAPGAAWGQLVAFVVLAH